MAGDCEIARDRMSSLKRVIKAELIRKTSSKKLDETPVECLQVNLMLFNLLILSYLGDKKFRTVLSEATKKDAILDKAVVPRRFSDRDRSSPNRRSARSRSQSPF